MLHLVLLAVVAMNVVVAIPCVLRGLWPVTPFMGLDVALLAWAFQASHKWAQQSEHILVTPSLLSIAKRPPKGEAQEIALNPYWARVTMEDPPGRASRLSVWSHGKGVYLGRFLAPEERASFAERLKNALWHARNGASFGS